MQVTAKRKDPAVLVRFPKPMLKELNHRAATNGRSRNSEILVRLAASLKANSDDPATAAG